MAKGAKKKKGKKQGAGKKKVTFKIATDAVWWMAVDRKNIPVGDSSVELRPSADAYLLIGYFAGEPGTTYEVTCTGGRFEKPAKGKVPKGGKDVLVAKLFVD